MNSDLDAHPATRRRFYNPLGRLTWRAESLAYTLIVAESAILYLYLAALLPDSRPPYAPFPGWLIFSLLAFAYFLPRLLDINRIWNPEFEIILTVGIALSLLLTVKIAGYPAESWFSLGWLEDAVSALIFRPHDAVRPLWSIIGFIVYAWWRGRMRADPMLDAAYGMLRFGTLALTAGLLFALITAPSSSAVRDQLSLVVVIFFSATLLAIGIARMRLEGIRSGSPLGPRWLMTFVAPILGVVLIAVIAAGIFSRRFLETVLLVLGPAFWVLSFVLRIMVLMIALLAFVIIAPLLWLLERQGFGRLGDGTQTPPLLRSFEGFTAFAEDRLNLADPVRYLIVSAILFVLASVLARYVFRRRRQWEDTTSERRESVLDLGQVLDDLTGNLLRIIRPARRTDALARLRGDPRWAHTVFIRETFIRVQRWSSRAGIVRTSAMTPDEYERRLSAQFPAAETEIRAIIATYDLARYSPRPATADEAETVRRAWNLLRHQPR